MILKHKDDVAPHLEELESLLNFAGLSKTQREAIAEEIWMIRAGAKGEKEAAYHIDFGWKNGVHSIVIHDLRIEHQGRIASKVGGHGLERPIDVKFDRSGKAMYVIDFGVMTMSAVPSPNANGCALADYAGLNPVEPFKEILL